jgi:4-hydroxybenzoate polyprenyltransferase
LPSDTAQIRVGDLFVEEKTMSRVWTLLEAMRPHQWVKNVLVFAPIVLAQQLGDARALIATGLTFVGFCLVASAGYLVNDILDLDADARHPVKGRRPLAAGRLAVSHARVVAIVMPSLAIGGVYWFVSPATAVMLIAYLVGTLAYSFLLKEKLFLDVLVLAGLYTHRVLTGGVAAQVRVSPWLFAFCIFFFLSLALLKRYVELDTDGGEDESRNSKNSRRVYLRGDLGLVQTMGVASGYLSVLVLGLYTSLEEITRYYSNPDVLWLVIPLMLYWISRIWLLARHGAIPSDPVLFAIRDSVSYVVFAGVVVVGVVAAFLEKAS